MFNKLKSIQQEDAFTLIELLVVILIIGILAAIAVPVFLNQQKAAINASLESDVHNTQINAVTFMTENPWASSSNNVFATGPGGEKFAFATTNPTPGLVISDEKTTLAVKFFGNGNYKVEGYNPNAKKVYSYDSTTGKYSEVDQGIATAVSPDKGAALGSSNTPPEAGSTTPPATSPAPANILKAYTFDTGRDGFSALYGTTSVLHNTTDKDGIRSGDGSVILKGSSNLESMSTSLSGHVVGQKYRISAYIKQKPNTITTVFAGSGGRSIEVTASQEWTLVSFEYTVTRTGHPVEVRTRNNGGNGILTYVDDITVEKIS